MGKYSWAGFPHPNEAGRGKSPPGTVLGVVFIGSLPGMVRLDGRGFGQVVRPRHRGLTGPSKGLGQGGCSWRSVLSLVLGVWESSSVRGFSCQREGEEGRPIMAPGVRPYKYNYMYGPTLFKSSQLFRTSGSRSDTLALSLMFQNPWTPWEKTEYTQKQLILFVNFY